MSKRDETKNLTLKRETLPALTPEELRQVVGGIPGVRGTGSGGDGYRY